MLKKNEKYCEKCADVTIHDRAKYLFRWYHRCLSCLERELKENGFYVPPFVRSGRINREKWLKGLKYIG